MSPARSRRDKWLDRLPLVRPVTFRRKMKSALSQAESAVRIARRAGSWMRRSTEARSSNGLLIGAALELRLRIVECGRQQSVITHPNHDVGDPQKHTCSDEPVDSILDVCAAVQKAGQHSGRDDDAVI